MPEKNTSTSFTFFLLLLRYTLRQVNGKLCNQDEIRRNVPDDLAPPNIFHMRGDHIWQL